MNDKRFFWNGTNSGWGKIEDSVTGESFSSYDDVINKLNELSNNLKEREKVCTLLEAFVLAEGYTFDDIKNFLRSRDKK